MDPTAIKITIWVNLLASPIEVLREVFARSGIRDQLHSDNGPQFVADEFKDFLMQNGVKQTLSAPIAPQPSPRKSTRITKPPQRYG